MFLVKSTPRGFTMSIQPVGQGASNADLGAVSRVPHNFNLEDIKDSIFGKEEYARYFDWKVKDLPLPATLTAFLADPCCFFPGLRKVDSHIVMMVPGTVNGKPLSLHVLQKQLNKKKVQAMINITGDFQPVRALSKASLISDIAQKGLKQISTSGRTKKQYNRPSSKKDGAMLPPVRSSNPQEKVGMKLEYSLPTLHSQLGHVTIAESYWVAIVKDIIPDSLGKTYASQKKLIDDKGVHHDYDVPYVMEVALFFIRNMINANEGRGPRDPWYRYCHEPVIIGGAVDRVVMGSTEEGGVFVACDCLMEDEEQSIGIVAARRL